MARLPPLTAGFWIAPSAAARRLWAAAATVLVVCGLALLWWPSAPGIGPHPPEAERVADATARQIARVFDSEAAVARLAAVVLTNAAANPETAARLAGLVAVNPSVSAILVTDAGARVPFLVTRPGMPVRDGLSNSALTEIAAGAWRNAADRAVHGPGMRLVRTSEAGSAQPMLGVAMQLPGGGGVVHLLGNPRDLSRNMDGSAQDDAAWLIGDDGVVLAGPTPGPREAMRALALQWRGQAGAAASGALVAPMDDGRHRFVHRQVAGWPVTVLIDAGPVDTDLSPWQRLRRGPMLYDIVAVGLALLGGLLFGMMRATRPSAVAPSPVQDAADSDDDAPVAAEMVRLLAGTVAHEVNNILTVLVFDLDMLGATGTLSAEQEVLRRSMLRATERGEGLTRTLQAYGGRAPLRPRRVDLGEPGLWQALASRTALSRDQTIAVPSHAAHSMALAVWADPEALAACLACMVDQVSMRAQAGARIEAAVALDARAGRVAVVIAAACAPDPEMVDVSAGLAALALGAAAGFARQSGGRLGLVRDDGQWRMTLHLPVLSDAGPAILPPARVSSGEVSAAGAPAVRVLVADDNGEVRDSVARWLRHDGHQVTVAGSVAEAESLAKAGIDLLVTDVVFDGVADGFALAARLRARDALLPLVFISGFMSARQPMLLAGDELASFVRKPVGGAELRTVVAGLLAVREWHRLEAASAPTDGPDPGADRQG